MVSYAAICILLIILLFVVWSIQQPAIDNYVGNYVPTYTMDVHADNYVPTYTSGATMRIADVSATDNSGDYWTLFGKREGEFYAKYY